MLITVRRHVDITAQQAKSMEVEMTDIRSSGFDSPAQFREYMADLDDYVHEQQEATDPNAETQAQIARLREDVRELGRLIVEMRSRRPQPLQKQEDRFWLRVGATVAATFILTAAVRYLRLGPAGTAAVALTAARINGAV